MLVWGDGGVPTFIVPSLCQSEVAPRFMSQPSHLRQAGAKVTLSAYLGPLTHSPCPCQDTLYT